MKIKTLYIIIFVLLTVAISFALMRIQNPEKVILGNWQEKSWEYEKVQYKEDANHVNYVYSSNLKDVIGKHLLIHTAESWHFKPNGNLILKGNNQEKKVQWALKGRGHILEIKYGDITERYNITEIKKDKIVLNFESDMQIKGLAKLTFEKS